MSNKLNLRWGTDPEVFAVYQNKTAPENAVGNFYAYTPAALMHFEGFRPVVDDFKHPILISTPDMNVIMDGVALEINLKQPFEDPLKMFHTVRESVGIVESFVNSFGYQLYTKPVVNFDCKRFWTEEFMEDEKFMQGVIFGCDKDEDAFNQSWECEIVDATVHEYRYGGGHIHTSGHPVFATAPITAIQLYALFAGNYSIANSPNPELDKLRAVYYGKAGKYRPQYYRDGSVGIEYRTPSNNWLNYSEACFMGLVEMIEKAVFALENPTKALELLEKFANETLKAIGNADKERCKQLLEDVVKCTA
jgi:hypothetical protein